MKKPRILARCLEPVAMTEEALRVCIAVASDDAHFASDRARAAEAAGGPAAFALGEPRSPMTIDGSVATIAVEGPLVRKAAGIAAVSGLTSYDAIRKDLRAALANPQVTAIDWSFDSPGGEVSGLFELSDEVYAARGRKPMRAIVADASSAAYVLAAAVGNIAIEQAGTAGSVGVRMGVQRPASDGSVIEFVSSGAPLKVADPATDEGRAEYQGRVDYLHARLVEKVAAYRGVTVDKVASDFGQGAVLYGAQAVAAGLVDRVGALASASAPINRAAVRSASRSPKMSTPVPPVDPAAPPVAPEEPAAEMPMDKCAGCESQFGEDAPAYCAACAGKAGEMGAAASRLMTLTGAANLDAALGTIAAAMESHRALPAANARIAALESDGNRRQLRATLEQGMASGRLNLGRIRSAVVDQLGAFDEAKGTAIAAALAGIPEKLPEGVKDSDAVLDAVCSVDPGAAGLRIVAAYCKSATPLHAEPHRPTSPDPAKDAAADAALDAQAQQVKTAATAARKTLDRGTAAARK
jgi:ClpP class serine protease